MTVQIIIVLAVLVLAAVLFITEKLRVDLVAVIVSAIALKSGILWPLRCNAGFSNTRDDNGRGYAKNLFWIMAACSSRSRGHFDSLHYLFD